MANEPLISVIVPVYNVEKYVAKCLDSIINQTYKNLEIIVVDDGSTDNSYSVCCSYAEKDDRIVLLQQPNGGQASARNYGIENAGGDYVGFVDSDDWIEPCMYEAMISAVKDSDCAVAVCGRYNVDEDTGEKRTQFTSENAKIWDRAEAIGNFLVWNDIDSSVCDKLFPMEFVKDQRFCGTMVGEDMMFVYEVLKMAHSVVQIGLPMYNYLQRSGSTSRPTVYTPKIEGLLIYPKQISDDAETEFPELKKQSECFKFTNICNYTFILCKARMPQKKSETGAWKKYN